MASEIKVDTVSEKTASGNLTLDVAGDIILDADGANVTFKDGGTSILDISNSSSDAVITSSVQDKDIIFKGDDGGSAITALTLDMSAAGAATFNGAITGGGLLTTGGNIVIPNAGNIGSASDADAIAIAANGVVTFSQNPVFPDGGVAVADLDIDGATDIGAAIVDADLFIVDDGAGGTNRKVTASRLKTYAGGKVLQVVSTTKTTTFTTTSSSFTDITGLTVDITPASSSNTILVISALNGSQDVGANRTYLKLVRDTTDIFIGDAASNRLRGSGSFSSAAGSIMDSGQPAVYLDSPSTTSAVTYKWQMAVSAGSGSGYLNRTEDDNDETTQIRAASTITVMEIGA